MERIANALPEALRADYYREMSHCRVLPESDEMLRILRAMQFLVVLIQQAPREMAEEREKLAGVLEKSIKTMQATHDASVAHQRDLEDRIAELPDEVSHGLAPGAIAERIGHDLRQRFADLPESVQALSALSRHLSQAVREFDYTASLLTSSYRGVAENARQAIDQMRAGITQASTAAAGAAQNLTKTYASAHRWMVAALCGAALVAGFAMGITFHEWSAPAPQAAEQAASAPAEEPTAAPEEQAQRKSKAKKKAPPSDDSQSRLERMMRQ